MTTTTTSGIIQRIESLGYATSVHLMGDYVEMHAVKLDAPDEVHIARSEGD